MTKQWWFGLTLLTTLIYFVIKIPAGVVHNLALPLDTQLPVWPILIWPYLLFLGIFWLVIIYAFWTDKYFIPLAKAIIVTFLVAYIVYLIYPAVVIRPEVTGTDWSSQLLNWVYQHDLPAKSFPSLHNASAALVVVYALVTKFRYYQWLIIYCLVVIISTVLLKQHYLADLIFGVLLGGSIGWFFMARPKPVVASAETS